MKRREHRWPPRLTRTDDVVDVLHGVEVADPYRWLEDGDDDEVRAWDAAQNDRTRSILDAVESRPTWHTRVTELLRAGTSASPRVVGERVFSLDRWGGYDQAVLVERRSLDAVTGRVLLDPAALFDDPTAAIDWYEPSRDGRLVAVGLSTGGSERSTLRVLDTATAELLDEEIPDTLAASVGWEPDGLGFVYTRYPDGDDYHRHVRSHRLGDDHGADVVVVAPDDLPDETAWPDVEVSLDGRWVLVSISLGWSRTDIRLLDRQHDRWATLIEGVDATTALTFDERQGRLIGVTTLDADRGRVIAADLEDPATERWGTLVPEDPDPRRVLEWAAPLANGAFLVRSTRWGVAELWHRPPERDAAGLDPIELPGGVVDIVGADVDSKDDAAVLAITSFTAPPRLYRWTAVDGTRSFAPLPGAPESAGITAVQNHYVADDGVAIPVFLVDGPDTPASGALTILTGYGGVAIAQTPAYSALVTAWCEAGGRFAVAGIRGGGEEGETWHRAGMREQKQRAFDDFFDAADWLVETSRTSRASLALQGGSNGGLLMGACITQRPDLAAAVHCAVPVLDMIRFHHFLIGRLWTPEYGDPDEPTEFAWLHAYSPYHRVALGTCYPPVLLTAAEEDTRVDPLHARKFGAALQAATSCESEHPILVRIESQAGHGIGKPVGKQADEAADVLAFVDRHLLEAPR
jgi:prolyl oligopeptidase